MNRGGPNDPYPPEPGAHRVAAHEPTPRSPNPHPRRRLGPAQPVPRSHRPEFDAYLDGSVYAYLLILHRACTLDEPLTLRDPAGVAGLPHCPRTALTEVATASRYAAGSPRRSRLRAGRRCPLADHRPRRGRRG